MFNLTKKNELTVRKSSEGKEDNDNGLSTPQIDDTNPMTNEMIYFQQDSRFRYQIWSNELISSFLLNLKEAFKDDEKETIEKLIVNYDSNKYLLNSLCELIVIFNSCSSYCQCSVIVETNNNSLSEVNNIKQLSAKLLAFLIQKINADC